MACLKKYLQREALAEQVKSKYSTQPSVHTNSLLYMHIIRTRVIEAGLI